MSGGIITATGQQVKILYGSGSCSNGGSTYAPNIGYLHGNVSFGYTFTTPPVVVVSGTVWGAALNEADPSACEYLYPPALRLD